MTDRQLLTNNNTTEKQKCSNNILYYTYYIVRQLFIIGYDTQIQQQQQYNMELIYIGMPDVTQ